MIMMHTLVEQAKIFATKAHEGQVRKTTKTPMIAHPIRVANTLKKAGFSPETVAAGFLHDVVEDTSYTIDDITQLFGDEVARIVAGNTEDKTKSWELRKEHTIHWIKDAPLEIKALIVADKLDNLSALVEDYETYGEEIWTFFKRGRDQQAWYFTSIAHNCTHGLEEAEVPAFFRDYIQLATLFFK